MQKHVNLVDLVKSFPTNIYLQNLASIQRRTSPIKFAHLAEKSGKGSISNLSTKATSPETAQCLLYVESLDAAACDDAGERFEGVAGAVDRAEENGSGQACYAFSSERCYAFSNSELERISFFLTLMFF